MLEFYERIRLLRKDCLKLSQEKFGKILGVNRSNINNIEGNRLLKPEQKEPLYKLKRVHIKLMCGFFLQSDRRIV